MILADVLYLSLTELRLHTLRLNILRDGRELRVVLLHLSLDKVKFLHIIFDLNLRVLHALIDGLVLQALLITVSDLLAELALLHLVLHLSLDLLDLSVLIVNVLPVLSLLLLIFVDSFLNFQTNCLVTLSLGKTFFLARLQLLRQRLHAAVELFGQLLPRLVLFIEHSLVLLVPLAHLLEEPCAQLLAEFLLLGVLSNRNLLLISLML